MLPNKYYGFVMASFGIGAALAAFASGILDKTKNKIRMLIFGGFVLSVSVLTANMAGILLLCFLWLIAGLGQSLSEMPSQILIAESIPENEQGKVYGAHFAWSHLWWAISYPIAGFTGTHFQGNTFLIGGIITFSLLILICVLSGKYLLKSNIQYKS
jgi:NRE family putative nickel resistance protein-like MFS transporter